MSEAPSRGHDTRASLRTRSADSADDTWEQVTRDESHVARKSEGHATMHQVRQATYRIETLGVEAQCHGWVRQGDIHCDTATGKAQQPRGDPCIASRTVTSFKPLLAFCGGSHAE